MFSIYHKNVQYVSKNCSVYIKKCSIYILRNCSSFWNFEIFVHLFNNFHIWKVCSIFQNCSLFQKRFRISKRITVSKQDHFLQKLFAVFGWSSKFHYLFALLSNMFTFLQNRISENFKIAEFVHIFHKMFRLSNATCLLISYLYFARKMFHFFKKGVHMWRCC